MTLRIYFTDGTDTAIDVDNVGNATQVVKDYENGGSSIMLATVKKEGWFPFMNPTLAEYNHRGWRFY